MTQKPPKPAFYLIDTSHPFYRPLGTRIAIVASVSFWAVVELISGQGFFMVISLALAAYCANSLLIRYQPPAEEEAKAAVDDQDDDEDVDDEEASAKDDTASNDDGRGKD